MTILGNVKGLVNGISLNSNLTKIFILNLDYSDDSKYNFVSIDKLSENVFSVTGKLSYYPDYEIQGGKISADELNYYCTIKKRNSVQKSDYFIGLFKRNTVSEAFSQFFYLDDTLINNYNKINSYPYMTENNKFFVFSRLNSDSWLAGQMYIAYNSTIGMSTFTGVSISGVLTILPSQSAQLTANYSPYTATPVGLNIHWSVSDSNIVSIDGVGNINALQQGTVTITATVFNLLSTVTGYKIITVTTCLSLPCLTSNPLVATCLGLNCLTSVTCIGNNCTNCFGIVCSISGTCLGSNCNLSTVSGIDLNQEKVLFELYPNPSTGIVNIASAVAGNLMVYNTLGIKMNELKIPIGNSSFEFKNGFYFYIFTSQNKKVNGKLIVK